MGLPLIFCFSSCRRHTISYGDWSSDVCSSDLERLHRGIAAAGVNKLHVEPVLGKVPGGARNLVRHAAQQLATIGKLDLLPLCLGGGGPCRRNDARDQRRALEHRAPRHVSLWHACRGFVAAAHANLRTPKRRQSINLCQQPEVPAVAAATVT